MKYILGCVVVGVAAFAAGFFYCKATSETSTTPEIDGLDYDAIEEFEEEVEIVPE